MSATIIHGDCRTELRAHAPFDMLLADPPYGDTSLRWDKRCDGWLKAAAAIIKPNGSMWVFGSMRLFQDTAAEFRGAGWRYAQDIVWEKQNGSGFATDRFKRVHEHIVQFYREGVAWGDVFNDVQRVKYIGPDKHARARKSRTPHTGEIGAHLYTDDGTRMMRSVLAMQNMQGRAIHPTEKPDALLEVLIRTSCPAGGKVADMFAGSGAGALAARMAGRNYVGCEIDEGYATAAQARLGSTLDLAAV